MIDARGRELDYLRLSVTDRCNLRCIYCMPEEGVPLVSHRQILRVDEILRLVGLMVEGLGVRKVRITGGEPLVRKGLEEIVKGLSQVGLDELVMTTNGVLLEERAQGLADLGLQRVNVSLDSLRRERLSRICRRNFGLERILNGIEAARKAGLDPVKVNCVVLRGVNDDEVGDFIRWGMSNDLEVRFIEHMPTHLPDRMFVSIDQILQAAAECGGVVEAQEQGGTARRFTITGTGYHFGVIAPFGTDMCAHCRRIRLTAEGRLYPCLGRPENLDLRGMVRGGSSDGEITRAARRALSAKPESHGGCGRIRMWRMGG